MTFSWMGKKYSGMLSEMEAEADRVMYINIGVGLNVNNDPTADEARCHISCHPAGPEGIQESDLKKVYNGLSAFDAPGSAR